MQKQEKLVLTKQYIEAEKEWNKILGNSENLSILFPPFSDSRRRVEQFMAENGDKYLFVEINLLDPAIEELADLENYIVNQLKRLPEYTDVESFDSLIKTLNKSKRKLVVASLMGDFLFTPRSEIFFPLFQKIMLDYTPDVTCLLCFESDVTHPSRADLMRHYSILFEHIHYYPLYSHEDSMVFINYLCNKWGLKLDSEIKNEIIVKCGGYFWLIKEALRSIHNTGSWSANSETFLYRLRAIAQTLNESEYSAIAKIITKARGLDTLQIHSREYLIKIGLLDDKNQLTTPLLKEEIIKLGASKRRLILENKNIFLNQVPVTNYFSRKELRIIRLLLSHEGEIVNRDQIGEAIWPVNLEENFSEWAIDQLIKRLRDRLSELLIPKSVLKSVRGKGYIYVQS